jgi:enoyl-CoA hydratase/carnithine racemase
MSGNVRSNRDGATVTITLANPAKRNALSLDVLQDLTRELFAVGESDATGIVLAAEGPVFSAGHNFADMRGASADAALELFTTCSDLMQLMHRIPQPIVARVHALATAAGCQLVAACDLAVAARSASFALPGGKGGLFCHTPLVAVGRALPPKRALEMALTGDPIDAETALSWGFVNAVVNDDDLDAAVRDLLERATRGSRASKALGKRTYWDQIALPEAAAYEFASAVMADAAMSPAAQEGIAAFLEKRSPNFDDR